MLQQVVNYRERIERSLQEQDLATLKEVSTECEAFMRANLPTATAGTADIKDLIGELELLVNAYGQAVAEVTTAKEQAVKQITSLGRTRNNTKTYLDVASQFNP
jgi:hypothetical protein